AAVSHGADRGGARAARRGAREARELGGGTRRPDRVPEDRPGVGRPAGRPEVSLPHAPRRVLTRACLTGRVRPIAAVAARSAKRCELEETPAPAPTAGLRCSPGGCWRPAGA